MTTHLRPDDAFNRQLVEHAHPADWRNPTATRRYHLVVIGGGTAGLVSAAIAVGLGGRVALIERHLLGGDCLNYGCVPSKALLRAARAAHEVQRAGQFGVVAERTSIDFGAVMQRMRQLRARISRHDSAQRFTELGVDVFLGEARFVGRQAIEVGGQRLRFARCVLATGARAAVPPIPGLSDVGYLTNETVFSLTERPARLLVVGTGPQGCELAQAFRRLGSEVHLIGRGPRLLGREEEAASAVLENRLRAEGIQLHLSATVAAAREGAAGAELVMHRDGQQRVLPGDAILVATGRAPNVESLQLASAGIEWHAGGVVVDDFLRTTNRRVYAAGDIVGSHQFTHAAEAMARLCIQNAFFFGRQRLSRLVVPHTTYTDPEIAHIGLTRSEAAEQGIAVDVYCEQFANVDRAVLDSADEGFAEVLCRKGTPHVVGATLVGPRAGELIGEVSLLMTARVPLGRLSRVIHPYPTEAEVLKRLADQYQRSRLTPFIARLLRTLLRWRR